MKPQPPIEREEETRPGRRSPTEERKRSDADKARLASAKALLEKKRAERRARRAAS